MGRVIVIGGGAAGMMAAVAAAESGGSVCLIEKNEKLGKKLFITGKGRCNVTNAGDMETLLANVCTNSKFLYSAFYGYDNREVMAFLEREGCPLKTERGDRVFPVSDHSSDVIGTFQRALKRLGVKVMLNTRVKGLMLEEESDGERAIGAEGIAGRKRVAGEERAVRAEGTAGRELSEPGESSVWSWRTEGSFWRTAALSAPAGFPTLPQDPPGTATASRRRPAIR